MKLRLGSSYVTPRPRSRLSSPSLTWAQNSYGVTFGSVLLLWGRISDLYSAKLVFTLGFVGCGLFNLGISFVTDEYAFYVLRGLYGVSAAATVSHRASAIGPRRRRTDSLGVQDDSGYL